MSAHDAIDRRIVLRSRPRGMPVPGDFELVERAVPPLLPGQVRVRNDWLGLAPAARLRMGAEATYTAPMALGDPIHGQVVGTVVASAHDGVREGEPVMVVHAGWQTLTVCDGASVHRIDPTLAPPSAWLGALGASGQTAWIGLEEIGGLRAGETVVVSAAAGAVGALAGQIARLRGAARVVGIAGGEDRCRLARDAYGYDACVDRHAPDLAARIAEACGGGADVYFDNTGGAVRDAVWPSLRPFGRVVVCGLVSEYNTGFVAGPAWSAILSKRLTVRGFIMSDHAARRAAFVAEMGAWYRDGRVRLLEHVAEGLEQAPAAFIGMLRGENRGKTLVRLRAP